jgi:hypothetical protein
VSGLTHEQKESVWSVWKACRDNYVIAGDAAHAAERSLWEAMWLADAASLRDALGLARTALAGRVVFDDDQCGAAVATIDALLAALPSGGGIERAAREEGP